MLREAREDRPGDVREGVQSERTSDGETGGVEEDAIGGERVVRVFCISFFPRGKDPLVPRFFFLVVVFARRARECFGPTAGARTRGERGDALFRRVVGSFTYRPRSMMCDCLEEGKL